MTADSPLRRERVDDILHVRLVRPEKRNAINDRLVAELHATFASLPDDVRAVVLSGEGPHFCAGLDLSEITDRDVMATVLHSRSWHAAFEHIQFGRVPVVAALSGATIGGGMELAASAHLRVADETAFYALPEGQRGIFVGGGGSSRIPRLVGVSTMTDMMLTGRVLDAREGQAAGFTNYVVAPGQAVEKAMALARQIAANAPVTNFAIVQALPRLAEMHPRDGLFTESLMAAVAQNERTSRQRVRDFLEKRAEPLSVWHE